MKIVYMDESGDEGYPNYSSPVFVLSAVYLDIFVWHQAYVMISGFRKQIKDKFGIPIKIEMHTKNFLNDKNPYRDYDLDEKDRVEVVSAFCEFNGSLPVRIINSAIMKPRIKSENFNVLDWGLKLVVQRIENDIANDELDRFLIITDPGRVGSMRQTTRRIQSFNPIPSKLHGGIYRKEISRLIEDPIQKESHESYFIQMADMIAYIVYLLVITESKISDLPNRLRGVLSRTNLLDWMEMLNPIMNLKASSNPYGIVVHPQKQIGGK